MDSESTGELMKQFSGSALANVAFGFLFLFYMGIKKICDRPSRCKSHIHCCCFDLDIKDKTNRNTTEIEVGEEKPISQV
jgi:hypothetical protein